MCVILIGNMQVYTFVYSIFSILLSIHYTYSCKNFLVQYCTDISIQVTSTSTVRCIQLIPINFDPTYVYSVKNYVVYKVNPCYNVISYDSSPTTLFSNECSEQCPDQYCLLFDNQPNVSIINVFYSTSFVYNGINSNTNSTYSYDYLLFENCSGINSTDRALLIVVLTLVGVIVLLAIGFIVKCIISYRLERGPQPYYPYDWRWLVDCVLCRIRRQPVSNNRNQAELHDVNFGKEYNKLHVDEVWRREPNSFTTSSQLQTATFGSAFNQVTDSSDPYHSSDSTKISFRSHPVSSEGEYIGINDTSAVDTDLDANQIQDPAAPESQSSGYKILEKTSSLSMVVTRH